MCDMFSDTELLNYLLDNMQATDPHMDNTFRWRLPGYILSYRANTAKQAVIDSLQKTRDNIKKAQLNDE